MGEQKRDEKTHRTCNRKKPARTNCKATYFVVLNSEAQTAQKMKFFGIMLQAIMLLVTEANLNVGDLVEYQPLSEFPLKIHRGKLILPVPKRGRIKGKTGGCYLIKPFPKGKTIAVPFHRVNAQKYAKQVAEQWQNPLQGQCELREIAIPAELALEHLRQFNLSQKHLVRKEKGEKMSRLELCILNY